MSEMDRMYQRIDGTAQVIEYVVDHTTIPVDQDVIATAQELLDEGFVGVTASGGLEVRCEGNHPCLDDED